MQEMRFADGVLVCYLLIVAMLLLIICDALGKWLMKMRDRDRERKMR